MSISATKQLEERTSQQPKQGFQRCPKEKSALSDDVSFITLNADENILRMLREVKKTQNLKKRVYNQIPVFKFSSKNKLDEYLISIQAYPCWLCLCLFLCLNPLKTLTFTPESNFIHEQANTQNNHRRKQKVYTSQFLISVPIQRVVQGIMERGLTRIF